MPEATQKAKLELTPGCSAVTFLPKSFCQGTKELWLACPHIVSPPPVSLVRLLVLIYIHEYGKVDSQGEGVEAPGPTCTVPEVVLRWARK